jgi:transcriptional regulator with XRE-family HTH domain
MSRQASSKPQNLNGGRFLSKRRRIAGMTQRALALELGVPEIVVSRYETGRDELPADLRERALKVIKRKVQKAMDALR